MARKKKKELRKPSAPAYMLTYGDMITLMLTFFVMMFTTATIDGEKMKIILSAFNGFGMQTGGNTLTEGKLAELGNTIEKMPSLENGRSLSDARKKAISEFEPEIQAAKVRVKQDERGLVISLVGDVLFDNKSAKVNIGEARDILEKTAIFIQSYTSNQKIRIEGHTDNIPTKKDGEFETNWELSTARAVNVLKYLLEYGCNESRFQVAGFADTWPVDGIAVDTEEGRAYNRRVEIVILSDGHLNAK